MDLCSVGAESPVFLYAARRALLVVHAACSIVLVGATTHHALQIRQYLLGQFGRISIEKTYAKTIAITYPITFGLGALLYPSYRVHVRGLYLDHHLPLYSGLFDIKEVFASLALLAAMALGALSFTLRPSEERWLVPIYAIMSFVVCFVVWLNMIIGLLVVSVRGVG